MTHPEHSDLPECPVLPVFDAAETAADIGRQLYDALDQILREARSGAISPAALAFAEATLARARQGVE